MNRLIILGIAVIAVVYIFVSSIFVVNEREQAIVMRFGQITDVKTEPGLYFKIPTNFVDTVQIVEDRLLRYDIANMTVQVKDGKFYIVDAFLTYRVSDPRLFRARALGDLRVVEDRISTRFDAALRQVYGLRAFTEALSEQRPEMMREARDLIRPDMAQLGIEVVDVRILRTDLDPSVSADTFNRMKAERLAEAALLRARGQEAAQTARAIADRQAVEILSAARRDAEILRGEGDGQRSQIFADAYNRDTDFFDFYRSMQSYRAALGPNGTTMVLSPDTEFFRFFQNQNPDNVTPPPEAATTPIPPTPLVEEPANDSPILSGPANDTPAPTAPADTAPAETAPAITAPAAEPAPAAPAQ
ncbi:MULTISPECIES: protease modulator HflC [unclassified Devosia]|jgi:membrane protease subunit HflC|uniref:protease modulator HflC n=1 Tax=unclassified Devosia TaxID=196773 RepID=UPI00086F015E|nr:MULTISPECIES: protease modulator HflC [unclassified Devosia]MBN9363749.1 protease modulator HflC [Devosia sp.]ODS95700.1 MAG: protease modulator HflC [Devosia sp. SCN 66-27]OJX27037.1 MAG: protease modulator HflC [Devosia sp. 66-14]